MPVSFDADIKPLFRPRDINCMNGHGVRLANYGFMADPAGDENYPDHAHARKVFCFLSAGACAPRMPLGGPYWSDAQLTLYQQWMDDGFLP